jgi:2-polyprenyl-3-methyl-5-hydroxy-6-metoxy-1,4-benzoquinol methylase
LDEIATEIVERIGEPRLQMVLDLGGGVSRIARLAKAAGHVPFVADFSPAAVRIMQSEGIAAGVYDIRRWKSRRILPCVDVATCTEVLEHLERPGHAVKMAHAHAPRAFFTVPNNTMGPAECPTHVRVFTMGSLRELLAVYWRSVRIDVRHRWLVAECRY